MFECVCVWVYHVYEQINIYMCIVYISICIYVYMRVFPYKINKIYCFCLKILSCVCVCSMTDSDGFKGIYPDFLELEREQDSTSSVHFLDTEIGFDGSCWFTKIFDKKEHPPLSRISQKRYPHPSWYISDRSKFGIITSRLHCFNRICQKRNDFVERCKIFIREFMSRGYSKTRVRFFCIRFFKSVPTSFPLPRSLKQFVNSLFPV